MTFFTLLRLFLHSLPPPPPPVAACRLRSSTKEGARVLVVIRDIAAPSPPSLQELPAGSAGTPFRPTVIVIVVVLASIFFVAFLYLMYVKHCKRRRSRGNPGYVRDANVTSAMRKHSGIERDVIESLPMFRFDALDGRKDGLECAVCLSRFESAEVMKLLPKCHHGFHVECVDTWLDTHSTCPLCREQIKPEDLLLSCGNIRTHENQLKPTRTALTPDTSHAQASSQTLAPSPVSLPELEAEPADVCTTGDIENLGELRRVSGRHSSAGDGRSSGFITQKLAKRLSFDNSSTKNTTDSVVFLDRQKRKDVLLLSNEQDRERRKVKLDHQINIVFTDEKNGQDGRIIKERWSDVHVSDRLYLRSDLILSSRSRGRKSCDDNNGIVHNTVNTRSMSDITAFKRFSNSLRLFKK